MSSKDNIEKQLAKDAAEADDSFKRIMALVDDDFTGVVNEETPIIFLEDEDESVSTTPQIEIDNELLEMIKVRKPKLTSTDLDYLASEELHNLSNLLYNVEETLLEHETKDLNDVDRIQAMMERDVTLPKLVRPNRDQKTFNRIMEKTFRLRIKYEKGKKVRADEIMSSWSQNERSYRKYVALLKTISRLRELTRE